MTTKLSTISTIANFVGDDGLDMDEEVGEEEEEEEEKEDWGSDDEEGGDEEKVAGEDEWMDKEEEF